MNLIRRSTWLAVILGAAAGCTGEGETPSGTGATGAPPPAVAPQKPVVPGVTKAEPGPEAASKEMQPAPAKEEAKAPEPAKANEPPKIEGPKAEGPKAEGKNETASVKLSDEEIANIKKLPAADQELAMKQKICPVSGEHLGEMGVPIKETVKGRTVFLCCDGCEEELKAAPDKFLAKLDAQGKK